MKKLKAKTSSQWPAPKTGPARARQQQPQHGKKVSGKNVPHARHKHVNKEPHFNKNRHRWSISIQELLTTKGANLLRLLRKGGFISSWSSLLQRHLGIPVLREEPKVMDPSLFPQRLSEIRTPARLSSSFLQWSWIQSFNLQPASCSALLRSVWCLTRHCPILNVDDKPIGRIYANLEIPRAQHVLTKEKNIVFGSKCSWPDVEADEVDLGKELIPDVNKLKWEQWGGIVERGLPNTLMLHRLKPNPTKVRAPGPGAIRRRVAKKHLANRNVILHTDGARAHKLRLPGLLHDNVVHKKKKKVNVQGKTVRFKPHYTKIFTQVTRRETGDSEKWNPNHRSVLGPSAELLEVHESEGWQWQAGNQDPRRPVDLLAQGP